MPCLPGDKINMATIEADGGNTVHGCDPYAPRWPPPQAHRTPSAVDCARPRKRGKRPRTRRSLNERCRCCSKIDALNLGLAGKKGDVLPERALFHARMEAMRNLIVHDLVGQYLT